MRVLCKLFVGVILTSGMGLAAHAQYGSPQSLKDELGSAPDLAFSAATGALPERGIVANTLFTSASANAPAPVLLLLPRCGGVSQHIYQWGQAAQQAGFGVMAVESLRGLGNDCGSPSKVSNGRYVKDAMDAVAFAAQQPGVDPKRIAVMGFSKGAMVATWLASTEVASTLRPATPRIAATVSLYGFCALGPTKGRPQGISILQPRVDIPFLGLMGAKDNELPPASCEERLPKLKEAGAPVQWHVYPQAGHAWDAQESHGFTKVTATTAERITYQYDAAATEDSRKRVFEFFRMNLQAAPQ